MSTMKGVGSNCLVNTPMSTGESMNEEIFFGANGAFQLHSLFQVLLLVAVDY